MGDMKEEHQRNPILKATPESEALVKRIIEGMSPDEQTSLAADLRQRAEEIEKQKHPEFRERLAETHRRNVREINRQTMTDKATKEAAEIDRNNMH